MVEVGPKFKRFDEVKKLGGEEWELVAVVPRTELGITEGMYFIFRAVSKKG